MIFINHSEIHSSIQETISSDSRVLGKSLESGFKRAFSIAVGHYWLLLTKSGKEIMKFDLVFVVFFNTEW